MTHFAEGDFSCGLLNILYMAMEVRQQEFGSPYDPVSKKKCNK